MTCKNNDSKKKIVCKKCECKYDENDNIVVTCTECEDGENKIITCTSCDCTDNDNGNTEICLKGCNCKNNDTVYISCTEYTEDLD